MPFAPSEPDETCPLINKLQDKLEKIEEWAQELKDDLDRLMKISDKVADAAIEINNEMEELRTANSDLRKWGKHYESLHIDGDKE